MKIVFNQKGFTIIEMLISIGILAVLATITAQSLGGFREHQAIANTVDSVVSLVNQARGQTLSAQGGTNYGVHFDTTSATLFSGSTYSSGAADNVVVPTGLNIELASVSLQGGGDDVVFDPFTGDTAQYGTLIVKRSSSTSGQRTLTISKTGAISSD